LVTIPGAGSGAEKSDQQDAAYFNALQFLHEQTIASAKPGHAKIARCQACCRLIPEGSTVCPFCGKPGPLAPISVAADVAEAPHVSAGVFARCCMAALVRPQVEFRSVFLAAMSLTVWYLLYRVLFVYLPGLLPSQHWQRLVFLALAAPLAIVTGGYCLQTVLDHIRRAASANSETEDQKASFPRVLFTGLMAVSVLVVYVLPIVTIPLLPVGLLALSMTRDARALSLRWSLRAAAACGEEFAILWLLMLLSAGLLALLVVVVVLLAVWIGEGIASVVQGMEGRILAEMVHLLGAALAGVLACFLACGPIRCVGLVAQYRPAILTWLPRRVSRFLTACAILLSVGILVLLIMAVV